MSITLQHSPIAETSPCTSAPAPTAEAAKAMPPANFCTPAQVLVVDDDLVLQSLASTTLRHAGFQVTVVSSGEEALEALAAQPIDIVLLDVLMSGIDGFETCARLRKMAVAERIPVIMLTGLNDADAVDQAYRAGATDFLPKPILWSLLAHRVRYALRTATTASEARHGRESMARALRLAHMANWELDATGLLHGDMGLSRILGLAAHEAGPRNATELEQYCVAADRQTLRQARQAVFAESKAYQKSYTVQRPDGSLRSIVEQGAAVLDSQGRVQALEAISQDVTERVEAERQIRQLALHDRLTGLPNSDFLHELALPVLERCRRNAATCAVLHVDIDDFRTVNDAHGRAWGDEVLRILALRLTDCTRGSDLAAFGPNARSSEVVARIGGNAFTLVLVDVGGPEHAAIAANRVMTALAAPLTHAGHTVTLSASVGISIFPRDGDDIGTLTRHAEQALYEAKKTGPGQHRFFDEEMNRVASARLAQRNELSRAVQAGELRLYLQPQFDAAARRIVGAEALVRWQHPQRGLLLPMEFIPLAEETGLILPLTDWVLEHSFKLLASWREQGLMSVPVAVNIASASLMRTNLVPQLEAWVKQYGVAPRELTLEVTESMLMSDVERGVAQLYALHTSGFKLSLDDFGTGYSSFSYLKRLPIDELKIDRAFIQDVQRGGRDTALVASIIGMARLLGLEVVAEGVETAQQAQTLLDHGCPLQQGYLFARPMPTAEFERLLRPFADLASDVPAEVAVDGAADAAADARSDGGAAGAGPEEARAHVKT